MSDLQMMKKQAKNLRKGRIDRMTEFEFLDFMENWLGADLDAVELAVFRCGYATDDCSCDGMTGEDCGCCENHGLWESPINLPEWEVLCGHCNRPAFLVEVSGRWGHIKDEPRRFAGQSIEGVMLRNLALFPAVRDQELDLWARLYRHVMETNSWDGWQDAA